jgi:hypothetical protein
MVGHVLEVLQQIFFWPGDAVLAWLLTDYPQLAAWLGVSATSHGGPFAALISVLVGWGLFTGLCHLLLLVVQLRETRGAHRHAGKERVAREPK